jgi:hypothetical protein
VLLQHVSIQEKEHASDSSSETFFFCLDSHIVRVLERETSSSRLFSRDDRLTVQPACGSTIHIRLRQFVYCLVASISVN